MPLEMSEFAVEHAQLAIAEDEMRRGQQLHAS